MTHFFSVDQVVERFQKIQQLIPASVKLIAITKQVPVELMRTAYEVGIRDFGESRIQEAALKQEQLQDLTDITWHLIGHLQSNKAAKALEQFEWIHSVDSLKLAQRLDQLAEQGSRKPNVCLQVKVLPDPNKYGWTIDELLEDLPVLDECSHLNILGLMTIPPYGLDASKTLSVFTRTRELAEQIQRQPWANLHLEHLSMGMSDDYQLAIEAGATMIRLGRTLFGQRQ
ncbi:MAG: YggS family pyridoxal phosphate-dependent enzyme [Elainellaceae cyanobacterium]